jgi:hypothetical protein
MMVAKAFEYGYILLTQFLDDYGQSVTIAARNGFQSETQEWRHEGSVLYRSRKGW